MQSAKRGKKLGVWLLLAIALQFSTTGVAVAKSPVSVARNHFKRGQKAYKAGRYDEAVAAFLLGYSKDPDPAFLLNIAQGFRKLNKPAEALRYLRAYLAAEPKTPVRAQVKRLIREIHPSLASLSVTAQQKKTPSVATYPQTASSVATYPQTTSSVATYPLTTPSLIARQETTSFYQRWWFWLAVVGVVGAGVGTALVLSSGGSTPPAPSGSIGVVNF